MCACVHCRQLQSTTTTTTTELVIASGINMELQRQFAHSLSYSLPVSVPV